VHPTGASSAATPGPHWKTAGDPLLLLTLLLTLLLVVVVVVVVVMLRFWVV